MLTAHNVDGPWMCEYPSFDMVFSLLMEGNSGKLSSRTSPCRDFGLQHIDRDIACLIPGFEGCGIVAKH